jgi:hypothetical protein
MEMIPSWAIGVAIIILAGSLGRAFAPMLRGRSGRGSGVPDADASQLRGELEDVQKRMGELEERLDFAERLLAKQRDAERLGGGS